MATNVIVFAGSTDGGSVATVGEARGAVQAADASAFVVATDDLVVGAMQALVSSTFGGAFAATDDPAAIAGYGGSVAQVVDSTWVIPFEAAQIATNNQITLTIDGTSIRASYLPGSTSSGRAPYATSSTTSIATTSATKPMAICIHWLPFPAKSTTAKVGLLPSAKPT